MLTMASDSRNKFLSSLKLGPEKGIRWAMLNLKIHRKDTVSQKRTLFTLLWKKQKG